MTIFLNGDENLTGNLHYLPEDINMRSLIDPLQTLHQKCRQLWATANDDACQDLCMETFGFAFLRAKGFDGDWSHELVWNHNFCQRDDVVFESDRNRELI